MNRREMFRLLPLSLLGLPTMVKAAPVEEVEPSPWAEMTCQQVVHLVGPPGLSEEQWNRLSPNLKKLLAVERWGFDCGQRFRFVRSSGSYPRCPRCGTTQNMSLSADLGDKITGIPVASE